MRRASSLGCKILFTTLPLLRLPAKSDGHETFAGGAVDDDVDGVHKTLTCD